MEKGQHSSETGGKAAEEEQSLALDPTRIGATERERTRMHMLNDAFDDLRKVRTVMFWILPPPKKMFVTVDLDDLTLTEPNSGIFVNGLTNFAPMIRRIFTVTALKFILVRYESEASFMIIIIME